MNIKYDTGLIALSKGIDFRSPLDKLFRVKNNVVPQYYLQKHLRDKHNIHVEVFSENDKYILLIHYKENGNRVENWKNKGTYDKHEDALEFGLVVALNMLEDIK